MCRSSMLLKQLLSSNGIASTYSGHFETFPSASTSFDYVPSAVASSSGSVQQIPMGESYNDERSLVRFLSVCFVNWQNRRNFQFGGSRCYLDAATYNAQL